LTQTEATNVYIDHYRLLPVTEVFSLRDDRKRGAGDGGVQLLCDVHWMATIHVASTATEWVPESSEKSRVSVSADEIDIGRKPNRVELGHDARPECLEERHR